MIADLTTRASFEPSPASRAKWRDAVGRHQLIWFFSLAYLFSWYPWIIALARGKTSGPNPLGPLVAALVVAGIAGGWPAIRDLLGRILRVRFGWQWYALVFGLPVLICGGAMATMAAFGTGTPFPTSAALRELPDRFIFIFLFIGLGEEPGWRGFALPRLQKQFTPMAASLILAPVWAIWHLPLLGNEFAPAIVPAFLISLLGGTLIQTWLFNRTKGSVFAQMLFHATVNTVGAGLIFPLFKGPALVPFWYVYATLWLITGFAVSVMEPARPRAGEKASASGVTVLPLRAVRFPSASHRNADRRGPRPRPDRT